MANKPMWEEFPEFWKTESSFMSFIRGGIRRGLWEKSPVKLQFIKENRSRVPLGKKTEKNPEGLVWGATCCMCDEDCKQSEIEVDHKKGGHSLKSLEDLYNFVEAIVNVTYEDLQLICKTCHKIKSYAERMGITFEEARIAKQVIAWEKGNSPIQQKEFLSGKGYTQEQCSNKKSRKECYKEYLSG